MIERQKEYLEYSEKVKKFLATKAAILELPALSDLRLLATQIKECELIVPIVGAFSSGKSSLLNTFLGEDYLPIAITPETSLATELRFSETAGYIEAIAADETTAKLALSEISTIQKNASEYKYMRVFLNNERLKEIEPFILVDMPGFDSPLDLHNRAIFEYLNRGSHYIVLTSVEDGNIANSMLRHLQDIEQYKRDFDFFLSKTDLRAATEVAEVQQQLQDVIEEELDLNKTVYLLGESEKSSFAVTLQKLEPNRLVQTMYEELLKENFYDISASLNTSITALQRTKSDNEQAVEELNEGLAQIVTQRDRMLEDVDRRFSHTSVNRIVENVGRDLTNSAEEIVQAAISGGQSSMSAKVAEITRSSLIHNVNNSLEEIADQIRGSVETALKDLKGVGQFLELSDSFIDRMSESSRNWMGIAQQGLKTLQSKYSGAGVGYKIITTILAVTTSIVSPILELVLIFLPDILKGFFQKQQQKQQEEQARAAIYNQIVPNVKGKLRTKLPQVLQEQVQKMISEISEQYETQIAQKRNDIQQAESEIKAKISNVEEEISQLNQILQNIKAEASKTLFVAKELTA